MVLLVLFSALNIVPESNKGNRKKNIIFGIGSPLNKRHRHINRSDIVFLLVQAPLWKKYLF